MADISTLNGYNLKDAQARSDISTINGKIGANNGIAELDSNGRVPSSQLPSYVDDVLEYASQSAFPATGETGKIYIALDTNKTFRWSGSAYVEISESLALGETSSTAYAGNKGKANADAISAMKDGSSIDSFGDVETAISALQPKNLSHSIAGESTVEGALDAIAAGSGVTVDDAMSSSSTNPVQNKVITSALAGKQDTLTFDNFPTTGSTNPVTSGGVKSATTEIWGVIGPIEAGITSEHAYEVGDHFECYYGYVTVIAPIAVGDTIENNVNVVGGTIASTMTQDVKELTNNVTELMDEVGHAGKNKLNYSLKSLKSLNTTGTWNDNVYTIDTVSFTVNDDLSVTVNVPSTMSGNSAVLELTALSNFLANGSYTMSGIVGKTSTTAKLALVNSSSTAISNVYDGEKTFIIDNALSYRARIVIYKELGTISNFKIEPMIRDSIIEDNTYYPYKMSIAEITDAVTDKLNPLYSYHNQAGFPFKAYEGSATTFESMENGMWYLSGTQMGNITDKPSTYTSGRCFIMKTKSSDQNIMVLFGAKDNKIWVKFQYTSWSAWLEVGLS